MRAVWDLRSLAVLVSKVGANAQALVVLEALPTANTETAATAALWKEALCLPRVEFSTVICRVFSSLLLCSSNVNVVMF